MHGAECIQSNQTLGFKILQYMYNMRYRVLLHKPKRKRADQKRVR